ncbi:MAG TPA: CRISPR-associated RAMP protein Csx7 [Thermoanaerobaculia bacterium]|nr:CRISPR-associated RAMP protein Csx7 [Thermoanaerobaculia bacterium]
MTERVGHHRLVNRYTITGALVCETALHIGSGGADEGLSASDLPIARDGRDRPYVPGSSFRGSFRATLESLLRGLGSAEVRVCDLFETVGSSSDRSCAEAVKDKREELKKTSEGMTEAKAFELAWDESCAVCRLFGQLFLASRVRVADLPLLDDGSASGTYVRDGVGLDRDLRTAAAGILYNFEAVPAGARFGLRLEIENADDHEAGLILTGLDLVSGGLFTLGGKSARGLGGVRAQELKVVRRTARDFFEGAGSEPLPPEELERLRSAARDHYVRGGE